MNKRHLHHIWTKVKWIKPWYFLVVAVISTAVCVYALRTNNQRMIVLRNEVFKADKAGTDVQKPLRNLQAYVTSHMNTDLSAGQNAVYPPIQLKYTYERLQAQNKPPDQNTLYSQAQAHCEALNHTDFSGRNRVPCIEQYVQSHSGTKAPAAIPDALYKFSFASPIWSPDLAGWTIIIASLSWLLFIATFLISRWIRR